MMTEREIRQELQTIKQDCRDETDPMARAAFAARICALQDVLGEPQAHASIMWSIEHVGTEHEEPQIPWPDPTEEMRATPAFEAVWQCIKDWDIEVPGAYIGHCGATGNHVRAILDALEAMEQGI